MVQQRTRLRRVRLGVRRRGVEAGGVRNADLQIGIRGRMPGRGLGRGLVTEGAEKSLGLLRRYESGLERGMYAAIAQLERLQARRGGHVQALPRPAEVAEAVCEDRA